jgi:hypothetical protein
MNEIQVALTAARDQGENMSEKAIITTVHRVLAPHGMAWPAPSRKWLKLQRKQLCVRRCVVSLKQAFADEESLSAYLHREDIPEG